MLRRSIAVALVALAVAAVPAHAGFTEGPVLGPSGAGTIFQPGTIRADGAGATYVLDEQLKRIAVFGADGAFVRYLGGYDTLPRVTSFAVGTSGELVVLDGFAVRRVRISDGALLGSFSISFTATDVAVDPASGALYLNDQFGHRLVRYPSAAGGTATLFGAEAGWSPGKLVLRGGLLVVYGQAKKELKRFALDGTPQGTIGTTGGFTLVRGLALSGDGTQLDVLDGGKVRTFSAADGGAQLREVLASAFATRGVTRAPVAGGEEVRLASLQGPVVRLRAADGTPAGAVLGRFPRQPGELESPQAAAVAADGTVVLRDSAIFAPRVDLLRPDGSAIRLSEEFVSGIGIADDGRAFAFTFDGIRRWGADGTALEPFPTADGLTGALGVAPDGSYAVVGSTIEVHRPDGTLERSFGTSGPGADQFGPGDGVALSRRRVAVLDRSGRVLVYDRATGSLLRTHRMSVPTGVAFDARDVLAVSTAPRVLRFGPDGAELGALAVGGTAADFQVASTVASRPDGSLVVLDGAKIELRRFEAVAPTTTLGGASGRVRSASFTLGSGTDGATFECRVGDGAWAPCTSPWTPSLPDGEHVVAARAVGADQLADQTPATRTVTVDTSGPVVTFTEGPSGTTTTRSASFAFTTGEQGATTACSLDEGPFVACTSPVTYDGLADGPHVVRVRGTDDLGNVGVPSERRFTVAVPAPPAPDGGGTTEGSSLPPGPGPGPGPQPPAPLPKPQARLAFAVASRVDRRGRVVVRLACQAAPCAGVLELRDGRRVAGRARFALAAGTRRAVTVKLSRAAAAKLRRTGRLRLVAVSGTVRRTATVRATRR